MTDEAVTRQVFRRSVPAIWILLLWGPGLLILMAWRLGPALLGHVHGDAQFLARVVLPLALFNGGYFTWEAMKAVVVDDRGVRISLRPARYQWSWDEIADVDVSKYTLMGAGPSLTLTDGTHVWLREAGGFSLGWVPRPSERAATVIAEQLRLRRGATDPARE